MLDTNNIIAMTPVYASRQPIQTVPHLVTDDADIIPPYMHPYDISNIKVPLVQKYNTRAIRLKGHNIMANHVTTIALTRKMSNNAPTTTTVLQTGDNLSLTNNDKVKVTIQTGQMNYFIFPELFKDQEYIELVKGSYNPNIYKVVSNDIEAESYKIS